MKMGQKNKKEKLKIESLIDMSGNVYVRGKKKISLHFSAEVERRMAKYFSCFPSSFDDIYSAAVVRLEHFSTDSERDERKFSEMGG